MAPRQLAQGREEDPMTDSIVTTEKLERIAGHFARTTCVSMRDFNALYVGCQRLHSMIHENMDRLGQISHGQMCAVVPAAKMAYICGEMVRLHVVSPSPPSFSAENGERSPRVITEIWELRRGDDGPEWFRRGEKVK